MTPPPCKRPYMSVFVGGGGGGQLGVFEELTGFLPKSAGCAKISFHTGGGGVCVYFPKSAWKGLFNELGPGLQGAKVMEIMSVHFFRFGFLLLPKFG